MGEKPASKWRLKRTFSCIGRHGREMGYPPFGMLWFVGVLVVAAIGSRQYIVRSPLLYWLGMMAFASVGALSTNYHRGAAANAYGIVTFGGWAIAALGLYGFPPKRPVKRPLRRP
jgi:hypothetical protein